MPLSRRSFIAAASVGGLLHPLSSAGFTSSAVDPVPGTFPSHDPALAREMVGVSHGNAARVRELLSARPALAKASWDWGYGDWESALGAASHVGNREIAEMLIAAGAPVTIFSAAMLGQLETVKAFVAASPGVQRVKGPHGISLLAHARAGKATEVMAYLESLGDADPRYQDDPLSEQDRAAIVGTYTYGSGSTEWLAVSVNARSRVVIQRGDAPERNLMHLGSRVFHPIGAEAVRIRFSEGPKSAELRVEDGPLIVVAARV
jgi:hypothetical protein